MRAPLAVIAGATALAAGPAYADALYGAANVGVGLAGATDLRATSGGVSGEGSESLKTGFLASVALGHMYDDEGLIGNGRFSLEAEAIYAQNSVDTKDVDAALGVKLKAKASAAAAMANLKYNVWIMQDKISPYVGIGVGFGQTSYEVLGESDSKTGFTWQAMGGALIGVTSHFSLDVGYRYLDEPHYKATDSAGDSIHAEGHVHALTIGARWTY